MSYRSFSAKYEENKAKRLQRRLRLFSAEDEVKPKQPFVVLRTKTARVRCFGNFISEKAELNFPEDFLCHYLK